MCINILINDISNKTNTIEYTIILCKLILQLCDCSININKIS